MASAGSSTVVLTVAAADWRTAIDNLEERCAGIVLATLEQATAVSWLRQGEVSLLLSSDDDIQELNARYRQLDKPTNVLSFPNFDLSHGKALAPAPAGPVLLGDIAMSFQRLSEEAAERGKPVLDHFAHLLIHGTLHLLGYDHLDDREARVMETMEEVILADLGMAAPYEASNGAGQLEALP